MKKLIPILGLAALAFACRAPGADVHSSSGAGQDCSDCTPEEKRDCSDCKGDQAGCKAEGEVCPVTGKSMN